MRKCERIDRLPMASMRRHHLLTCIHLYGPQANSGLGFAVAVVLECLRLFVRPHDLGNGATFTLVLMIRVHVDGCKQVP